jgi:hypothetical protein
VNSSHGAAHAELAASAALDPRLGAAFAEALPVVGIQHAVVPGRPKRTLLDPYFLSAGVDGMTNPLLLETLVASDLLPVERPFVVAHEWAHLAGIANEGEANFVGWLTTLHGPAAARYSGWLYLYREVAAGFAPDDRAAVARSLDAGPRADLTAIAERARRHVNPSVAAAGWRVYDSYLKANRVDAGAASYAEVVKLVLGTDVWVKRAASRP